MDVLDATFKTDQAAQDAVREGIAQAAGVPPSSVTLTIDVSGSTYTVGYTITVPTADAGQVQTAMTDTTVGEINGAVKSKVEAVKGASYTVTVTEKSPVTVAPSTEARGQHLLYIFTCICTHGAASSMHFLRSQSLPPNASKQTH